MRTPWIPFALLVAFALGCSGTPPTGTKTSASKAPSTSKQASTPAPAVTTASLSGTVIAPAGLIAQGGGNLVAQGGGNLVAQGGGNLIAQGGGNYLLLAEGDAALADATVIALDADGKEVERTKTNSKGEYTFEKLEADRAYELVVPCKGEADGVDVRLATVSKPRQGAKIGAATSCAAGCMFGSAGDFMLGFDADAFQKLVDACDATIKTRPLAAIIAALSKPAELPAWGQKLAEANPDIKTSLENATKVMKEAARRFREGLEKLEDGKEKLAEAGKKVEDKLEEALKKVSGG